MYNYFVVFFCIFQLSLTYAQDRQESELRSILEDFRVAILDADSVALNKLTSDKLNYWHSNGNHENKQAFIKSLVSGKSDFKTLEFANINITLGNNVATAHYLLSADTNDDGVPGQVHIGVLMVFQQEDREWKLFARQAFKLNK